jgi:hypothetical protein
MGHGDEGVIRSRRIGRTGRSCRSLAAYCDSCRVFGDLAACGRLLGILLPVLRFVEPAGFDRAATSGGVCRACRSTGIRPAARANCCYPAGELCRGSGRAACGIVGRGNGRLFEKLLCWLPEGVPRSRAGSGGFRRARIGLSAAIAERCLQGFGQFEPASRSERRRISAAVAYRPVEQYSSPTAERLRSAPAEHLRPFRATLHAATRSAGLRCAGGSAELCSPACSAERSALRSAKLGNVFGQASQSCAIVVSAKRRRRTAARSARLRRGRARRAGRPAGLQRFNAVSQAVAYRPVPRFDATASTDSPASAEHVHGIGTTLYAARAGGRGHRRCSGAAGESR